MPNTRELTLDPKLHILIWSPSGKGKTTLAGTGRKAFGPMYFWDFDLRIQSLTGLDIDYDQYFDFDIRRPTAYDKAFAKLEAMEALARKGELPYSALCCDGLTSLATASMNKAFAMVNTFMPNTKRMGDGKVQIPQMQDYMAQMTCIEDFIRKLNSLPCHTIVTAHEDSDKDEVTQKIFKNLAVTGKLAGRLPGYFNEVWRMEVSDRAGADGKLQQFFKVRTRPDSIYTARTSYPGALTTLEDPDLSAIYNKITTWLNTTYKQEQADIAAKLLGK